MSKNFLSFVLSYNPSSIIIRTCPDTDIEKCPSIVLWFSDWSLHWWVVFSTNPLIIQNNLLIFLSMTAYCFDFWSKYCSEYHYSRSNSYKGQVKNNEAKVWQYGHETWKMNFPFDAPASFFPSHKWLDGLFISQCTHPMVIVRHHDQGSSSMIQLKLQSTSRENDHWLIYNHVWIRDLVSFSHTILAAVSTTKSPLECGILTLQLTM